MRNLYSALFILLIFLFSNKDGHSQNVGIGTASPATRLHLLGTAAENTSLSIQGQNYVVGGYSGVDFQLGTGNARAALRAVLPGSNHVDLAFYTTNDATTNTADDNREIMRITGTGNVGIGTSSPNELLDVRGAITLNNQFILRNTDLTGDARVWLSGGVLLIDQNTPNMPITFRTNTGTLEKMRISWDGNVGIGTSNPQERLHIVGNEGAAAPGLGVFLTGGGTGNAKMELRDGTPYIDFDADATGDFDIRLIMTGTDQLNLSGGNLDLENNRITTVGSPTAGGDATNKTYVDNLVTGADEWTRNVNDIYPTSTSYIVGIGNTNPQHTLNVGEVTSDGQLVSIRGYSNTPSSWKGGAAFGYSSATVIMGELSGVAQLGGHNANLTAWTDLGINVGGGNVGVGTSTPVAKLDVNGTVVTRAQAPSIAFLGDIDGAKWIQKLGGYQLTFSSDGPSTVTLGTGDVSFASRTYIPKVAIEQNGNMYVSGNVGIGTTAPGAELAIRGDEIETSTTFEPLLNFEVAGGPFASFYRDVNGASVNYLGLEAYNVGNSAKRPIVFQEFGGNVGIGSTNPLTKLDVLGNVTINNGSNYANANGHMASGSLTIGGTNTNFGGGTGWTTNTAGLLFETLDNTEIAVHDNGQRIASLMYYQGGGVNQLTIGRNMGWDNIARTNFAGDNYAYFGPNSTWGAYLQVGGNGRVGTDASVVATNGNLHLDPRDGGYHTYINFYSQGNTFINPVGGLVGVGNTSPGHKLDVTGWINSSDGYRYGGVPVIYNAPTDVYANIRVLQSNSTINDGMYINYNSTGGAAADLRFFANGTSQRMHIEASNGFVGIGTDAPTEVLDVTGSIKSSALSGTGERVVYADAGGKLIASNNRPEKTSTFFVGGDVNTFYPVQINGDFWGDGESSFEIIRASVHTDGTWAGSFSIKVDFHSSNWGHGEDFYQVRLIDKENTQYVAGYELAYFCNFYYVWLRGGRTYTFRSANCSVADYSTNNKSCHVTVYSAKTSVDAYVTHSVNGIDFSGSINARDGLRTKKRYNQFGARIPTDGSYNSHNLGAWDYCGSGGFRLEIGDDAFDGGSDNTRFQFECLVKVSDNNASYPWPLIGYDGIGTTAAYDRGFDQRPEWAIHIYAWCQFDGHVRNFCVANCINFDY